MKRLIALLLAAALALSLAACGSSENNNSGSSEKNETGNNIDSSSSNQENQMLSIGDTFSNEDFEFTLTDVEFANELYTFANDANTECDDNFMLPLTDGETNPGGLKIKANEDKILLTFTFNYKFIGKSAISDNFDDMGAPCVFYGDGYIFDGNDTSSPTEYPIFVKKDTGADWYILNHVDGLNVQGATNLLGISPDYEPFDNTIYECRGYITLPLEVYENKNESLEISFGLVNGSTDRFTIK